MTKAKRLKIRTRYNPQTTHPVVEYGPTLTQQWMAEETDINNVVRKYQTTGAVTHFAKNSAFYADVPATDFTEAMILVAKGENMFRSLPSTLRDRFKNDPTRFLEFVQDEANAAEMEEMGLRPSRPYDFRPGQTEPASAGDEPAEPVRQTSDHDTP